MNWIKLKGVNQLINLEYAQEVVRDRNITVIDFGADNKIYLTDPDEEGFTQIENHLMRGFD